jgi:hypothetical protein
LLPTDSQSGSSYLPLWNIIISTYNSLRDNFISFTVLSLLVYSVTISQLEILYSIRLDDWKTGKNMEATDAHFRIPALFLRKCKKKEHPQSW